jgi:hypothetical protein
MVSGLQASAQIQLEVLNTPFDKLAKSPEFNQLVLKHRGNRDAARRELASIVSDDVAIKSGLTTTLLGAITGGGVVGHTLRTRELAGSLKRIPEGMKEEAVQEFFQSGGEHVAEGYVRKEHLDPTINPWKGAVKQPLEGSIVGSLTGGAFSSGRAAVSYGADRFAPQPPGANAPPATPPSGTPGATTPPGTPGPTPPTGTQTPLDNLTEDDINSPLNNQLISDGKRLMDMYANNGGTPIVDEQMYPVNTPAMVFVRQRDGSIYQEQRFILGMSNGKVLVNGDEEGQVLPLTPSATLAIVPLQPQTTQTPAQPTTPPATPSGFAASCRLTPQPQPPRPPPRLGAGRGTRPARLFWV